MTPSDFRVGATGSVAPVTSTESIVVARGAGAYGRADTANAVPLFWLVRHTVHFAVPLFRPSNNNFPIELIFGAVSRRNKIMFMYQSRTALEHEHSMSMPCAESSALMDNSCVACVSSAYCWHFTLKLSITLPTGDM